MSRRRTGWIVMAVIGGSSGAVAGPALRAVDLAAGDDQTCAVLSDRTVRCWGSNEILGQLGAGPMLLQPEPQLVPGVSDVEQVVTGATFGCARLRGGTVRCWGRMKRREPFGTPPSKFKNLDIDPMRVIPPLRDVQQLAAGALHACALHSNGRVSCWGHNLRGELGRGHQIHPGDVAPVPGLEGVVELALGGANSCALLATGEVRCWGETEDLTQPQLRPQPVPGLQGVRQISAGGSGACALLGDRTVACWSNGRLGRAGPVSPVPIAGLTDAVQIAAGSSGGCATRTDGSVWCWGYPGPLVAPAGAAASRDALVAAPLAGLTDVTEVRVDGTFLGYLCALHRDGGVTCGGERYRFPRAAEPGFHRVTGMSSIRALAIGQDFQCALRADRRVECWGENPEGQTGQPAPTTSPPVRVSGLADVQGTLVAGWHQTCLLGTHRAASSAGLYCWGAFRPAPTRVDSPTVPGTIVEIALSESACVRTEQNRVFCFDDSTLRTPGIMDRSRDVARNPPDLRDPVAVAVSERQACAVQGDGTVACWNGGIGPTVIRGITGARSVALAPEHHGCAIMTDDRVACWSVSREDPDVFSEAWPVFELQGARSLALEVTRGCALMPGGILRCWNDTLPDEKHPPRQMLTGVSKAVSGLAHTCALRTTGEVLCWGFNASGQLGTGTPSRERTVPVRVAFPP